MNEDNTRPPVAGDGSRTVGTPSARPLVGLIVPSSNPTVERLLSRGGVAAVLGIDVVVTRLRVLRIAADAEADAQFAPDTLLDAARLLADAGVRAGVWAGTSGFWLGAGGERAAPDAVAGDLGVPAGSSREGVLAALTETGVAEVAVLTPYVEPVHDAVVAAVTAAGFTVTASQGLGLSRNPDFAEIDPAELAGCLARLGGDARHPVAVVCTNVAAARPAPVPVPVVDSVIATLWWAARMVSDTAPGYAQTHRRLIAGAS
ncbi:MAG: maleate isomerase [Streptomycetaceae bacterium]|nr:maleate isomerase [Streptomycetaceae bacterium]